MSTSASDRYTALPGALGQETAPGTFAERHQYPIPARSNGAAGGRTPPSPMRTVTIAPVMHALGREPPPMGTFGCCMPFGGWLFTGR